MRLLSLATVSGKPLLTARRCAFTALHLAKAPAMVTSALVVVTVMAMVPHAAEQLACPRRLKTTWVAPKEEEEEEGNGEGGEREEGGKADKFCEDRIRFSFLRCL